MDSFTVTKGDGRHRGSDATTDRVAFGMSELASFEAAREDDIVVGVLSGEVDLSNAAALERQIAEAVPNSVRGSCSTCRLCRTSTARGSGCCCRSPGVCGGAARISCSRSRSDRRAGGSSRWPGSRTPWLSSQRGTRRGRGFAQTRLRRGISEPTPVIARWSWRGRSRTRRRCRAPPDRRPIGRRASGRDRVPSRRPSDRASSSSGSKPGPRSLTVTRRLRSSTDTVTSMGSSAEWPACRTAFVTSSLVRSIASSSTWLDADAAAVSLTNRRASTNDAGRERTARDRVGTRPPSAVRSWVGRTTRSSRHTLNARAGKHRASPLPMHPSEHRSVRLRRRKPSGRGRGSWG